MHKQTTIHSTLTFPTGTHLTINVNEIVKAESVKE